MKKLLIILLFVFLVAGCDELETIIEDTATATEESTTDKELVTIDRVVDGDTVIVEFEDRNTERIRLLLIDTPESVHPEKEPQPYGEESSEFAKGVLQEGKEVEIERGNPERDNYERILAYIWVDGENFNQLMIEEGYARVGYVYEPNTKYLEEFEEAQQQAEEEGENIWSIDGYVESRFENY
ncbi:thermonuclease family protein [Oceanobacillus sp. 1P07AA]|uniref:thermonuclease family protein n=1 Tax=Oceanobacillus sp. 1P07AA TaxID=3132293 RepID=UPI0039A6474B